MVLFTAEGGLSEMQFHEGPVKHHSCHNKQFFCRGLQSTEVAFALLTQPGFNSWRSQEFSEK